MQKNFHLFVLQAALAGVVLLPSASELAQSLDQEPTPVQTATRPVPMPVVRERARTAPMPTIRPDRDFAFDRMPTFGVANRPEPRKQPSAELWNSLFDGQRSRD